MTEAPRLQPHSILPRLQAANRPDDVAFLGPQMQQAAPLFCGDGIARRAHVEDDTAVFKHRRLGVLREKALERVGQFHSRDFSRNRWHCHDHAWP